MNVKLEGFEPYYFLAQHPRGLQSDWLVMANTSIFKEPLPLPSGKELRVQIFLDSDDLDKPKNQFPISQYLDHSRFCFFPLLRHDDHVFCMQLLSQHQISQSLMLAIYEEKIDTAGIIELTEKEVPHYLEKNYFEKLVHSINFVDEIRRGVDLLKDINQGLQIDTTKITMVLKVETSEKDTREFVETIMKWQTSAGRRENVTLDFLDSLAAAFKKNAKNNGYPNWKIGHKKTIETQLEDETLVILKCFFSTHRMCVGLELFNDHDIHPYLEGTFQQFDAASANLIANWLNPKPGEMILDLCLNKQDVSMACMQNYDYLIYYNITSQDTFAEYYNKMNKKMNKLHYCEQVEGNFTHIHEYIKLNKWHDVLKYDDLLSSTDKFIIEIDLHIRKNFKSEKRLWSQMNDDYVPVFQLFYRLPVDKEIILICPTIDMAFVDDLLQTRLCGARRDLCASIHAGEELLTVFRLKTVDDGSIYYGPRPYLVPESEPNDVEEDESSYKPKLTEKEKLKETALKFPLSSSLIHPFPPEFFVSFASSLQLPPPITSPSASISSDRTIPAIAGVDPQETEKVHVHANINSDDDSDNSPKKQRQNKPEENDSDESTIDIEAVNNLREPTEPQNPEEEIQYEDISLSEDSEENNGQIIVDDNYEEEVCFLGIEENHIPVRPTVVQIQLQNLPQIHEICEDQLPGPSRNVYERW